MHITESCFCSTSKNLTCLHHFRLKLVAQLKEDNYLPVYQQHNRYYNQRFYTEYEDLILHLPIPFEFEPLLPRDYWILAHCPSRNNEAASMSSWAPAETANFLNALTVFISHFNLNVNLEKITSPWSGYILNKKKLLDWYSNRIDICYSAAKTKDYKEVFPILKPKNQPRITTCDDRLFVTKQGLRFKDRNKKRLLPCTIERLKALQSELTLKGEEANLLADISMLEWVTKYLDRLKDSDCVNDHKIQ